MSDLWERLDGETDVQYDAFVTYRDLAPHQRSIRNATCISYGYPVPYDSRTLTADQRRKVGNRCQRWERHSLMQQWVERVRAWDDHLDEIRRGERVDAIRNMSLDQAQLGRAIWNAAVKALNDVLESGRNIGQQSDRVVLAFAAEGAKIQRAAYGLNTYVDETESRVADPQVVPRALLEADPAVAGAAARLALAEAQARRKAQTGDL